MLFDILLTVWHVYMVWLINQSGHIRAIIKLFISLFINLCQVNKHRGRKEKNILPLIGHWGIHESQGLFPFSLLHFSWNKLISKIPTQTVMLILLLWLLLLWLFLICYVITKCTDLFEWAMRGWGWVGWGVWQTQLQLLRLCCDWVGVVTFGIIDIQSRKLRIV